MTAAVEVHGSDAWRTVRAALLTHLEACQPAPYKNGKPRAASHCWFVCDHCSASRRRAKSAPENACSMTPDCPGKMIREDRIPTTLPEIEKPTALTKADFGLTRRGATLTKTAPASKR